jgi:flagellar hook-basal body complex protein FliE
MTPVHSTAPIDAIRTSIPKQVTTTEPSERTFGDILKTSLNDVNRLQIETDDAIRNLVSGKEKNVHEVMIAMEKAALSLELLVQVRNKVIAAYEEIKRMQI